MSWKQRISGRFPASVPEKASSPSPLARGPGPGQATRSKQVKQLNATHRNAKRSKSQSSVIIVPTPIRHHRIMASDPRSPGFVSRNPTAKRIRSLGCDTTAGGLCFVHRFWDGGEAYSLGLAWLQQTGRRAGARGIDLAAAGFHVLAHYYYSQSCCCQRKSTLTRD